MIPGPSSLTSGALRRRIADVDLDLDAAAMARLGQEALDAVITHLQSLRSQPAVRRATREAMERRLREPLPQDPHDPHDVLQRLKEDVLPYGVRTDHPGFFAYIPLAPTFPGIVGDLLATGTSVFGGSWLGSAGASMLELVVTDWFRELVGLPETAAGVLTSGGSMASVIGLACARTRHLDGKDLRLARLYTSDQAHGAVASAARLLGLPREATVELPSTDSWRLDAGAVRRAIAADRAAGRLPFCVAASAGTTHTGAVDPLADLADACRSEGLWFHVDGAYGGFAVLTERGRQQLSGIEAADSVVLDPHKWLYQPLECGCVLVRDEDVLTRTFGSDDAYLQDIPRQDREVSFFERGPELSRRARAVKVWLSLQIFGARRFAAVIDKTLDLAAYAAALVDEAPDLERLAPVPLSTVAFRYRRPDAPADDELQRAIVEAMIRAEGPSFLSSTRLGGQTALRLCVLSHRTTADDVVAAVETVRALGRRLGAEA